MCSAELSLMQMEMGLVCFEAFETGFSGEENERSLPGEGDVSGLGVCLGFIKGMIWMLWRGEEGLSDGNRPPRGGGGGVLLISPLDASMLSSVRSSSD